MAVTQLVLTGVPSFVGVVDGATTVQFFIDQQDFDPAHLIPVDLAKNPSLPPAQWATGVDVDTTTDGGYTTIGPRFHNGAHVGAVYLADRLYAKYGAALASWPPAGDELYQYRAVLRAAGDGTVTRFHGFKVSVRASQAPALALLEFIPTGGSPGAPTNPMRWIDLNDPTVVDPAANGFTQVTPTTPVGTVGSLFITAAAMQNQGMSSPKVPKFYGGAW